MIMIRLAQQLEVRGIIRRKCTRSLERTAIPQHLLRRIQNQRRQTGMIPVVDNQGDRRRQYGLVFSRYIGCQIELTLANLECHQPRECRLIRQAAAQSMKVHLGFAQQTMHHHIAGRRHEKRRLHPARQQFLRRRFAAHLHGFNAIGIRAKQAIGLEDRQRRGQCPTSFNTDGNAFARESAQRSQRKRTAMEYPHRFEKKTAQRAQIGVRRGGVAHHQPGLHQGHRHAALLRSQPFEVLDRPRTRHEPNLEPIDRQPLRQPQPKGMIRAVGRSRGQLDRSRRRRID